MRGGMAGGGAKLAIVDGGQSMSKGTVPVFKRRYQPAATRLLPPKCESCEEDADRGVKAGEACASMSDSVVVRYAEVQGWCLGRDTSIMDVKGSGSL